jgi:uncharacterized membrane protein
MTTVSASTSSVLLLATNLLVAGVYFLMPYLVFPTIPFGVRIPLAYAQDPVVLDERRRYTLRMAIMTIAVLAAVVLLWLSTHWMPVLPLSSLAIVFGSWGVYYLSHHRLQAVKANQHWFANTRQAVLANVEPRSSAPSRMFWAWLALPVAVIAITATVAAWRYPTLPEALNFNLPFIRQWTLARTPLSAGLPVIFQFIATLLFSGGAWLSGAVRQALDVENPEGSQRQELLLKQLIQALLFSLALGFDAAFLLSGLAGWGLAAANTTMPGLFILAPLVIWIVVAPGLLLGLRTEWPGQSRTSGYVNRDDDRFWKFGILYVNPDDPVVLVNKRFGIGRTLNFGHPLSWVVILIVAVLIGTRIALRLH